jgi:hypothetical protein
MTIESLGWREAVDDFEESGSPGGPRYTGAPSSCQTLIAFSSGDRVGAM